MLPPPEAVGQFAYPYRFGRGREEIQQHFEPLPGHPAQRVLEHVASAHEEAAQQVCDICFADEARQPSSEPAEPHTAATPVAKPSPRGIAAADYQIDDASLEEPQHLEQQPLVVLKIAVHHGNIRRRRGEHSLDASSGEPATADPLQTSDSRVRARNRADTLGRAVPRVIVDKDRFPRNFAQCRHQQAHQRFDVISLIEGWNDYGQNGSSDRWHAVRRATIDDRDFFHFCSSLHAYALHNLAVAETVPADDRGWRTCLVPSRGVEDVFASLPKRTAEKLDLH